MANQPPPQLGLDTNILRHPTPRRFFLSFMERIGAQAHLSPTVQNQIVWEAARQEEMHWANRRMQQGTVNQGQEDAILHAVEDAAREWAVERLVQPSAIINPHVLSDAEMKVMRTLYNNMPDRCFKAPGSSSSLSDRKIIAEMAAAGVPIIISQNMNSIVQRNVNAWLRERKLTGQSIMFSDDFIDRWLRAGDKEGRPRDSLLLDIVCGACLPESQGDIERDSRAVFSFIGWMYAKDAPLPQTGLLVEALLKEEGIQRMEDRFNRVRRVLPKVTRSIESDRLRRVDQAAEAAGWSL